jgi:predicted alpha/beta-fold hydrolase
MYTLCNTNVRYDRDNSDWEQYIGEEGSECVLKAAIVLSNPWNLEAGSLALQRTFLGLEVYLRAMGTSMKALFET